MSDNSSKAESKVGEAKPPKLKAEDNPWYLLATLYGEAEEGDHELRDRNRVAWNRYFAASLDEKTRALLIEEKRHPAEELTRFSPKKLQDVREAFAKRSRGSTETLALPENDSLINFSNVQFDRDVDFEGYLFNRCSFDAIFSGRANFKRGTFSVYGYFQNASFLGCATFENAKFFDGANFESVSFCDEVYFVGVTGGVTFDGATTFVDATFSFASFQSVTFSEGVNFTGATFFREAIFVDATFSEVAAFSETKFSWVRFERATFSNAVLFNSVVCSGKAVFTDVIFGGPIIFVNAEIKGMTSFENATFETEPPRFSGAKLHEGTIWRGIKKWPTPKKADKAGVFVDAYERLKLEMNRLQKHEDELDFFALELQSRRVEQGLVRGLPIALYGVLSDYGRSYVWPFVWLFAVAAFGAAIFRHFGALTVGEASGLSVANTFNVFGFRKDFFEPAVIARLPGWLDVIAAVQTVLGTILLFLFGLGVRNKFRMK